MKMGSALDFCHNRTCEFQITYGKIANMFESNELIFSRVLKVTTRGLSKLYGFYIIPTITQIENIGGNKKTKRRIGPIANNIAS